MSESPFIASTNGRPVDTARVGGLSDLRQIDLNLYYTIKEKILPLNGYVGRMTETLQPGAQEQHPETGALVTPYAATFDDFVYYNPDPAASFLTGLLVVPTISTSGNLAWIDYLHGKFYYSGLATQNITTTYDYYSVRVQDGYPDWFEDPKRDDDIRIPLVTVEYLDRRNKPFELGGGFEQHRRWMIDVVGASDPQRDDLSDTIEDSLRYTYKQTSNYTGGFPIGFKGDVNPLFDRGSGNRWKEIRFQNVQSRVIRNPFEVDKFRHRTVINLMVETYD